MARFYGLVQGGRGKATRLGHATTGLHTYAASHSGAVAVYFSDKNGVDWVHVYLTPHRGEGVQQTLYQGPISTKEEDFAKATGKPLDFLRRA